MKLYEKPLTMQISYQNFSSPLFTSLHIIVRYRSFQTIKTAHTYVCSCHKTALVLDIFILINPWWYASNFVTMVSRNTIHTYLSCGKQLLHYTSRILFHLSVIGLVQNAMASLFLLVVACRRKDSAIIEDHRHV